MTDGAPEAPGPATDPDDEVTQARLRRAPRLPVFLVIGAVLGVIAALVATAAGHVDPKVGFGPTFGYLCIWLVPVGLALGAVVGIVLDRISTRRARLVVVERARVDEEPGAEEAADHETDQEAAGLDPVAGPPPADDADRKGGARSA